MHNHIFNNYIFHDYKIICQLMINRDGLLIERHDYSRKYGTSILVLLYFKHTRKY